MKYDAVAQPRDNDLPADALDDDRSRPRPAAPARAASAGVDRLHAFDVFDTLITRCWRRPEDVFLDLGERLRAMGLVREAAENWAERRVAAEAALRRVPGTEEVDLRGIYSALAPDMGWGEAEARAAMQAELACEEDAIRPIAENVRRLARLQSEGAQVALLSDTYFDRGSLLRLLGRAGVAVPPERVFASSALGASKRTGRMFGAVSAALGVPPAAIAHTGDHPESDFAVPRAAGVRAELYTAGAPTRFEEAMHAATAAQPAPLRSSLAGSARAARLSFDAPTPRERVLWAVGATVAGPLLCGFVLWALRQARLGGLSRLYFVARDGQILKGIADVFCARLGWRIDCRYLFGSRQAWHLPAVERLDETALVWLTQEGARDPLRAVLARAELDPSRIPAALARHGFGDASALDSPAPAARVAALLRDPEVESALLAAVAERRRSALGYLRQEGLMGPGRQAMVDLGWHGRLQQSLRKLLDMGSEGGRAPDLDGYYLALVSRPPGFAPDAMRAFLTAPRTVDRLNPVLFEIFCAADHGTTRRYAPRPDGGFAPDLAAETNGPALAWGLRTMQGGIAAFASELAEAMARAPGQDVDAWVDALRDGGAAGFDLFRTDPSKEEAEMFGAFPHADGQSHDTEGECAPAVTGLTRLRLGLGFKDATYAGHWPEASVRRSGDALGGGLVALRRLKRRLVG